MLQGNFAEFLQLYSSITFVYSTYSLVSVLIRYSEMGNLNLILDRWCKYFSSYLQYKYPLS